MDQCFVLFGAWRSLLVWALVILMVRFGRLTSWRSWDLLHMVPENLPDPQPPSTQNEVRPVVSVVGLALYQIVTRKNLISSSASVSRELREFPLFFFLMSSTFITCAPILNNRKYVMEVECVCNGKTRVVSDLVTCLLGGRLIYPW